MRYTDKVGDGCADEWAGVCVVPVLDEDAVGGCGCDADACADCDCGGGEWCYFFVSPTLSLSLRWKIKENRINATILQADNDPYGTHQDPTTVSSHPNNCSPGRVADLPGEWRTRLV